MGYVPEFEHDVFVAFAEEDNAALPGGKQGWVDQFVDCLLGLLRAQGIKQAAIHASMPGHLPSRTRLELLDSSATVAIVLSPAYLECDWHANSECVARMRRIGESRPDTVFVVEKSETERGRTAEFDHHRHDKFWMFERGIARTLGIPDLQSLDDRTRYYDIATGLSNALAQRMKQLAAGSSGLVSRARPRVFLAEAPHGVEARRSEVQRYLEQAGVEVVPRGRLPLSPGELDREVDRQLAGCRAFVQLLGVGSLDEHARARIQLDRALAKPDPLSILHWRDPALDLADVADLEQRELLLRDTVRAETITTFCQAVKAAATSPGQAPSSGPRTVFVDAPPQQIGDVERIFRRYAAFKWDWHQANLKTLKRLLEFVDGVILYWGHGDSSRTQERYYLFARQFRALRKNLNRLLIYDGPPPDKPEFSGTGFQVANGRHGDEPDTLRNFLRELEHAG